MSVQILVGSALDRLREIPDESIHCCVTSPPYWGLRSYKLDPGMIGLEPTFDEHLANLLAVFREVRRVLRKDGTCWLNYGDAYANSQPRGSFGDQGDLSTGAHGELVKRTGIRDNGWKPKDLMLMPARVAIALQEDGAADAKAMRMIRVFRERLVDAYDGGPIPDRVRCTLEAMDKEYSEAKGESWWLRSEVIWHKPNPMPESVRDRPTSAHEKLFLLSKSSRYFYDADAVRTPSSGVPKMPDGWDTGTGAHGSTHRNGREKGRKTDKQRGHIRRHDGLTDRWDAMSKSEQQANGSNLRNVWKIATSPYKQSHFATFPPKLVEPCIKAGTSEKGVCSECGAPWVRQVDVNGRRGCDWVADRSDVESTGRSTSKSAPSISRTTTGWLPSCSCDAPTKPATVLDCFAGAGTVGLVADRLGRDAVLIEISPEYAEMARKRIHDENPLFADVSIRDSVAAP